MPAAPLSSLHLLSIEETAAAAAARQGTKQSSAAAVLEHRPVAQINCCCSLPLSFPRVFCACDASRRPRPLASMLHAAFFSSKPQPPPLTPQLVDATVSRCPSPPTPLALSFFLWCALRPGYFHPPPRPPRPRLPHQAPNFPTTAQALLAWGPLPTRASAVRPNAFACNVVLDVLLTTGQEDAALRFLRDNPSPNYLTYAVVLTHRCRPGDWSGVRCWFTGMLHHGFVPSPASLTAVFACCSKAGTVSELLQLLSFAHVSGCNLTSAMWTCLIARLCREGRLEEARWMLPKMVGSTSSPTVVTYTPLVRAFLRAGKHDMVSGLLGYMESTACSPDIVLYNVLMDCMAKERRYDVALDIYMHIRGSQIKPDAYSVSTLARVVQLLSSISLISCDLVACNSVLSALCKSGFPSEAIRFFFSMIDNSIWPDSYTYVGLLDTLCQLGGVNQAISFYLSIVENNPKSNAYVHSAILCGLVRQGQNVKALTILREAVRKNYDLDAVCYTIVLHGLFCDHLVEAACRLFDQMKRSGIASNTCTYNVMLRGLCRTRDLHAVKQLLTEMECADVEMDSISFNTVIVLLIKSRRIGSAAAMIGEMLNLGMQPSTKTCSLLSQSVGYEFVLEDNTTATVETDGSDSSSGLLVCSAA